MGSRQIILDTETTGLDPSLGDRIIEIGCVEIIDRRLSGRRLHRYVNPGRDSDPGALAVHGLTTEFLQDKPRFEEVVDELCEFVKDAEILIHNAAFDVAFLNAELALLGRPEFGNHCLSVSDTLAMAKELYPGKRNSLDALCERYGVSNARRTLHGALLDAELLAEVYLAMTRGQESLTIDMDEVESADDDFAREPIGELIVVMPSPFELSQHDQVLAEIEKESKRTALFRAMSAPQEEASIAA